MHRNSGFFRRGAIITPTEGRDAWEQIEISHNVMFVTQALLSAEAPSIDSLQNLDNSYTASMRRLNQYQPPPHNEERAIQIRQMKIELHLWRGRVRKTLQQRNHQEIRHGHYLEDFQNILIFEPTHREALRELALYNDPSPGSCCTIS